MRSFSRHRPIPLKFMASLTINENEVTVGTKYQNLQQGYGVWHLFGMLQGFRLKLLFTFAYVLYHPYLTQEKALVSQKRPADSSVLSSDKNLQRIRRQLVNAEPDYVAEFDANIKQIEERNVQFWQDRKAESVV